MRVSDIASNGLVYALDPAVLGEKRNEKLFFRDEVYHAIGNILRAQQFDAIPLVPGHNQSVTHLARRRLHAGDEHDVYVLTRSEVECVSRDMSILEAIFLILSNEHHILLLEDQNGNVTDILTISMLADEKVKSYLRLKVSQLQEDEWNWNSNYLSNFSMFDGSNTPTIEYASNIFNKINALAELISEHGFDKECIPSDRDVSQLIVEILADLQPLKPFKKNMDALALENERFYLKTRNEVKPENTAKQIQKEWGGSLIDNPEKPEIVNLAFKLFGEANDWDEILIRKTDSSWAKLSKSPYDGEIEESDVKSIHESASLLEIAKILFENSNQIIVVENDNSKWPGIITIHDFALNKKIQNNLLLRFTQIEMNCRAKLVSEGTQYMIVDRYKKRLISVVNFKDVVDELDSRGHLKKRSKQNSKLNVIRFCRNKLVHDIIGHGLYEFPKYLHYLFLNAFIDSHELINLFEIDERSDLIYRNIVALDAFVIGSEYLLKRKTPKSIKKLIHEFEELVVENQDIIIKVKSNSVNIDNALDNEMDLGTWREMMRSYFEGVSKIKIVNVQD
jgi:CBS domain-containing protein